MKGLIATVENPGEPILQSIEDLEPDVICSYYSPEHAGDVNEIRSKLNSNDTEFVNIEANDPQDFGSCFEEANRAIEELANRNIYPNDTVLDYAGGTKIMSSALVAATLGKGFQYALLTTTLNGEYRYVFMGGEGEDGDGSNYIKGGEKELLASNNPWEIRALESKRKIQHNFNNYRFHSVIDQINSLESEAENNVRDAYLLQAIGKLAEGYSQWDKFNYSGVKEKLREGIEDFETYRSLARPESYLSFSPEAVEENIEFLSNLQEETFGFDFGKRLGRRVALDMFWNATRRAEEEKYDDATVRLYRTVEMIGQIEVFNELGHHTDSIPVEQIPEALRDPFTRNEAKQTVELGLRDNFLLLDELGNPVGKNFLQNEDELKKVMHTRNTSFLTHNFKVIEANQFSSLKEIIEGIFDIDDQVKFPKLEIV
jgi:CRISPR-associated protein (TIGR02710 family)